MTAPRRFGSGSARARPSSTISVGSNSALATSPPPLLGEVGRQRSQSSASNPGAAVASAAQQWLSAFAPRGEGRGREFLTNTLSGVANVASTVGQEVNGFIVRGQGHSRPNSFSASSPPPPETLQPVPVSFTVRERRDSQRHELHTSPSPNGARRDSPTVPAPVANPRAGMSNGRRAPAPANLARLGNASAPPDAQVSLTSPTTASTVGGPNDRRGSANTTPTPGLHRTGSTGTQPKRPASFTSTHARASSFGAASPLPTATKKHGTPYKIGFQPSGVRRDVTAEYVAQRRAAGAERDKEEGRLGRRWAKLVDLHFNPTMQHAPGLSRSASSSLSLSSIASGKASLSLDGVTDSLRPREVWRGLKAVAGPGPEEARKRAAEQRIVKWEEDAEVKKCRICAAAFSLSTRKHHCRLCGRIVCSLPPTPTALLAVQVQLFSASPDTPDALPPGMRREKCSLLLVADWRTGRGEEVDEGFVGWMSLDQKEDKIRPSRKQHARHRSSSILSDVSASSESTAGGTVDAQGRPIPLPQQPQEIQIKGVRVCRECWATVSRKQKMADRARVTPFARLYAALRSLQAQIEALLAIVDDGVADLQVAAEDAEPSAALLNAHKALLGLLGHYDAVAKKISALPCAEGGSQAAVQSALARSAAGFLARAAASATEVPRLQRRAAAARGKNVVVVQTRLPDVLREGGVRDDAAEDVARALQPLLEQQAQLESFIAEANAQRKYDDARSLAAALHEIDGEIARLTASALA